MAKPRFLERLRSVPVRWQLAAVGAGVALVASQFLVHRSHGDTNSPIPATRELQQNNSPKTDFEPSDWPVTPVVLTYVAILVVLVISAFVLIAAYPNSLPDVDRALHIAPPGPNLETNSQADLKRFRAAEEKRLNSYYWIDQQNGVVHIPIEEAMKKLATTGIPGFPKAQQ